MNAANLRWVYSGLVDDLMIFSTATQCGGNQRCDERKREPTGTSRLSRRLQRQWHGRCVGLCPLAQYAQSDGCAGSGADGDKNGTINQNDYSVWSANFGATGAASGTALGDTVPEPATWVLVVVALLRIQSRRRSDWARIQKR